MSDIQLSYCNSSLWPKKVQQIIICHISTFSMYVISLLLLLLLTFCTGNKVQHHSYQTVKLPHYIPIQRTYFWCDAPFFY